MDDVSADLVVSQLLFLDAEDPTKDIKIFINSPGGSITAGRSLFVVGLTSIRNLYSLVHQRMKFLVSGLLAKLKK